MKINQLLISVIFYFRNQIGLQNNQSKNKNTKKMIQHSQNYRIPNMKGKCTKFLIL